MTEQMRVDMSRVEKVREFRTLTRCGLKTAIEAVDGGWNPGDPIDRELTIRLDEEHRKAAQIRSAAPQLLEAAQNLLGLFDSPVYRRRLSGDTLYYEAICQARDAVFKATANP